MPFLPTRTHGLGPQISRIAAIRVSSSVSTSMIHRPDADPSGSPMLPLGKDAIQWFISSWSGIRLP